MKTHIFLLVVGLGCLLSFADADCDMNDKKQDVAFPDITKSVADSYIMGVEYTVPGAAQTDYYTEYYELAFKRGRVESHINGQNQVYIYRSETWEAWAIGDKDCILKNITIMPDFFKDAQTDWLKYKESDKPTTIGPSAMFKTAFDLWNSTSDRSNMAYMGAYNKTVRGEEAVYWRRCLRGGYVDYIFAAPGEENPFDSDVLPKFDPLRVTFNQVGGTGPLSTQIYDIINFQPFIPKGIEPFQLPKGRNCQRGGLATGPKLGNFSSSSLLLNAEVVYTKMKDDQAMSTYYSTLMFALDRQSNHLAYYYSPWSNAKPDSENKEPFVDAPEYIIYDFKYMYKYNISIENGNCSISRVESYLPLYKLPENGGSLTLTDPYVLFPNSELEFLTEGKNRGLDVDIFEAEIKDYLLDKTTTINRAIISHSFLRFNEELENTVAIRNAPVQLELRFFRDPKKPDEYEILTLNIFGFTTRIPAPNRVFDVKKCFKNDDDYVYLTIGFEIENQYLPQIDQALVEIEREVLNRITGYSELNRVRMPDAMTDVKDNYVYVTVVILGKPTLILDFPDQQNDKKIKIPDGNTEDTQGVSSFDVCASNCLENRGDDCWGFSMCGSTCNYGSKTNIDVEEARNCTLFKRYDKDKYMRSKDSQAKQIVAQVQTGQFFVMAKLGDKMVTLTATVADITDPAEDDSMFDNMGNILDPRMRVLKAGAKLKKGSTSKNLGKLRYDECQSLCLDFKTCETLSYCLKKSECLVSTKYGSDLKDDDKESNDLCILLTRKYADHFVRTPGVFVENGGGTKLKFDNVEDCARACLTEDKFKCLSFDHCAEDGDKKGCSLYSVHYLSPKDRKASVTGKNPRCGHYTRKYSTEFKRKDETRVLGSKVPPITNLTLEECAKTCVEYGQGTCFGYDFCQDKTLYGTSCTIIDSDPSRLETAPSPICTNYVRTAEEYAPHPYTNSYAGGIGFLCFVVGGVIGAAVVFAIAYFKANRG